MDEAVRQISALEKEIVDSAGSRQDLRMVSDYYRIRAEKYEILGQLPQTRNTFALSGYVPAFQADKVVKEFSEK